MYTYYTIIMPTQKENIPKRYMYTHEPNKRTQPPYITASRFASKKRTTSPATLLSLSPPILPLTAV